MTLVVLVGMLYWSSLLVEIDLKQVKQEIQSLKETFEQGPLRATNQETNTTSLSNPHINPALPNLLEEDPFFAKTLAELLPKSFVASGTRNVATIGRPDNLHPLSNWRDVLTWRGLCTVGVSRNRFGFFERYSPNAAFKVEERVAKDEDALEYWIFLRPGIVWQPLKQSWFSNDVLLGSHFLKKHPLTAHDFKFQFDTIMNPFVTSPTAVVLRQYYNDIIEFRVIDDHTFVVKWKSYPVELDGEKVKRPKYLAKSISLGLTPLASFVYQYYPDGKKIVEDDDATTYLTNSTFAQNFMEHWAKNVIPSCGPMRFEGMSDQAIYFSRNRDHFGPLDCLVQKLEIQFKQTVEGVWQAFKSGDLDSYNIQPDQIFEFNNFLKSAPYLQQVQEGKKIHTLEYVYRAYSYIGWNEARPLFKSKKVRQAMTMGINRQRIIQQIANGMGLELTAPFYPFSNAYDPTLKPWPFDPLAAKRLLEEEGFADLDGDGFLEKQTPEGVLKFEFALTYFVKNPTTKAISEYVATALKEIGVKCNLNGVDVADLSALFDEKNFDAYILSWALGDPPEDPRQLWHSSGAREKGSSNAIGFSNEQVDTIIDALTYTYDKDKRTALFYKLDRILFDEAPYTFIYTPRITMAYREYLQNVFLPIDRQDIIPGATVAEPDSNIFWLKDVDK